MQTTEIDNRHSNKHKIGKNCIKTKNFNKPTKQKSGFLTIHQNFQCATNKLGL